MPPHSSRPFSTVSPVHPNYLPTLHKSSRMEKRLVAATIAAVGVGYGISAIKESGYNYTPYTTAGRKSSTDSNASTRSTSSSSSSSSYHRYSSADDASHSSQKRREMAMLDAYGDRGSLEELEAAVAAYTAQQQARK